MRTTGRSDLVCWIEHSVLWQLPCPPFAERVASATRSTGAARAAANWLVAIWLRLFGLSQSIHAVFAREAPVRPGEMRRRPGVWWPRVVTMRFVAGGENGERAYWRQLRVFNSPRLVAWRERRATLAEVIRHHGAALYEQHGHKLSWRWFVRGQR